MVYLFVLTLAVVVCTATIPTKRELHSNAMIPNISISSYLQAIATNDSDIQSNITSLFDKGFHEWGVVRIIDHQIDVTLMRNTMKGFKHFFKQNEDYKMQYDNGGIIGVPGYVAKGSEKLDAYYKHSTDNDLLDNMTNITNKEFREPTESFHIVSNWQNTIEMQSGNPFSPYGSECPAEFSSYIRKYYSSMRILLKNIHLIASHSLGYNYNIFESKMVQHKGFLGHRATYYYPLFDEISKMYEIKDGYYLRLSAHRDFASFAFVHNDEIPGFQIKINNSWYNVQQIENSLLLIGGDFIRFWTNDYWKTTLHRVVTKSKQERLSIATFSSTDLNEIIDTLPDCAKCTQYKDNKFKTVLPVLGEQWMRKRFEDIVIVDDFDYDNIDIAGTQFGNGNECAD